MRKFFLYILCTMIVSYFDIKYNLKSILLFTFFVISILYFNDVKNYFKTPISKPNSKFVGYILLFCLSFTVLFSLLPSLIFSDYKIDTIENFTNYDILNVFLFTPILEELIFRGSLFAILIEVESTQKSIFLSSLGFTLAHYLSDTSFFTVFILGSFLTYVYLKTKNIFLCIIVHALNNFLALVFSPFLISMLKIKETSFYMLEFIVISSLIMAFSFFKIYKQSKN